MTAAKSVDKLYNLEDHEKPENQIRAIKNRGVLRVGFLPDCLPFAFKNDKGEVLGYDIEMAYILASELNVRPEFYKINKNQIKEFLGDGRLDIVMSGIAVTTDRLQDYGFSNSYLDQTLAFLVEDFNRSKFQTMESLKEMDTLRIGCASPYFSNKLKKALPKSTVINEASPRSFLKGNNKNIGAFMLSAEAGSAWTIIFPAYNVVVPENTIIKIPSAYPMPKDEGWIQFVNTWIELKSKDGTKERLFEHWVEGKGAELKEARWSIMKDVLHWTL